MANVIRHPRCGAAASTQLRRLRKSVEDDRERAVATLSLAVTKLEALRTLCDAAVVRDLTNEFKGFLDALRRVDPANIDDGLCDQLAFIQRRLTSGLGALEILTKTAQTPPDDLQGEPHGR